MDERSQPPASPVKAEVTETESNRDSQSVWVDEANELAQAQQRIRHLEAILRETQQELQEAKSHIAWMETSKFWKMRLTLVPIKDRWGWLRLPTVRMQDPLRPLQVLGRQLSQRWTGIPAAEDGAYQRWLDQHYPTPAKLQAMAAAVDQLTYQPTISVIMPVYNCPARFLQQAIASVQNQVYPHWELCIADDASTASWVRPMLEQAAQADPRIKVEFRSHNGHISASSNTAIALATGEFIALFDHDDLLAPHALFEVVQALNQQPEVDMIYTDEDKIDEHNVHKGHYFKPDWSPDSLLSRMYTCHLGVYRRSLIDQIGGFRLGYEGSQDHDLVLRFTELTDRIHHIPNILYHWRIHSQSAASGKEAKPYAYIAAKKAIAAALERRGEPGEAIDVAGYPGLYTVRYDLTTRDRVSIIIPTRDHAEDVERCLNAIWTKTTYANYDIIVVDNGSTSPELAKTLDLWQTKMGDRLQVLPLDIPFNFATLNNRAAAIATGRYLLFLNNDTQLISPDWLEGMVAQAQRRSVGAVGAKLLYEDTTVQHAGVILGVGGIANHGQRGLPPNAPGYNSTLISVNNFAAVTGACLMCRREVFEQVGGFDESLAVAYNDIDLCLKFRQAGYWNLVVPYVQLFHFESKSRGAETTPAQRDRLEAESAIMRDRWGDWLNRDPFYNPHLTHTQLDFSLRVDD